MTTQIKASVAGEVNVPGEFTLAGLETYDLYDTKPGKFIEDVVGILREWEAADGSSSTHP
jgi:hypothetical protein